MSESDDLDARLRALLADDRLALPVADGTDDAVLAGARRRRRNRMAAAAAGGALAATAAVFVGVAAAGLGRPVSVAPAGPRPVVLSTTDGTVTGVGQPPPVGRIVLGPTGSGGLVLGMSLADAEATGQLVGPATSTPTALTTLSAPAASPTCATYGWTPLPSTSPAPSVTTEASLTPQASGATAVPVGPISTPAPTLVPPAGFVAVVASRGGLVELVGGPGVTTPRGIGIGSTLRAVQSAYPGAAGSSVIVVPAGRNAEYRFTLNRGIVTSFSLTSTSASACGAGSH